MLGHPMRLTLLLDHSISAVPSMGEAKIMGRIELNEQLIPKIGRTAV